MRTATSADLLAVVQLLTPAAMDPSPSPPGASNRQRAMWDRMMATADLTVYVVDVDGDVVGTASLLVLPNLTYDCRPTAFIEPVLVAPDHRRRGVGRIMLDHLIADARTAGCHKVQLLSHKRHAEDGAYAFYRSLGFDAEAEGFRRYLDQ